MQAVRAGAAGVAMAMLIVAPGDAGGQFKAVVKLNVYDAGGRKVGPVFDLRSPHIDGPAVAFKIAGRTFYLGIGHDGFVGKVAPIRFESPGCAGSAWVESDAFNGPVSDVVPLGIISGPGQTVYVRDFSGVLMERSSESAYGTDGRCIAASLRAYSAPVVPVVNFEGVFTPPFRVR